MIEQTLQRITIGEPQTYRNLTVYPLHIQNGHERKYHTLDEAIKAGTLTVSEVDESGSVPRLAVKNTGKLPVLMIVGETLIGAKQNRVLNTSLLVPAESDLQIPVSCVEQGRWSYSSRHFTSSGTTSHAKLRQAQTRNVTRSLRAASYHDADQGEVWSEVSRKLRAHGAQSTTSSLYDAFRDTERDLQPYLDAFAPPQAEGILVMINGQVAGTDLFDHAETLEGMYPKLLRGYALDALEDDKPDTPEAPGDNPQAFLKAAGEAEQECYEAVGMGQDVRLTGALVSGSSLLWDDHTVHTTLFKQ